MGKLPKLSSPPAKESLKNLFRFCIAITHPAKDRLGLVCLLVLLNSLLILPSPFITRYTVDFIMVQGHLHAIPWIASIVVIMILIERSIAYAWSLTFFAFTSKILAHCRLSLLRTLRSKSWKQLKEKGSAPYLASRIIQDSALILDSFCSVLLDRVVDIGVILFGFGACFWLNPKLTGVLLILVPSYLLLVRRFSSRIKGTAQISIEKSTMERTQLQEALALIPPMKLHNSTVGELRYFGAAKHKIRSGLAHMRVRTLVSCLLGGITRSAPLLLLLLGAIEVQQKRMSIGSVLAMLSFSSYVFEPSKRVLDFLLNTINARVALGRIQELLDLPEEDRLAPPVKETASDVVLKLDDLSFSYTNGIRCIDALSLRAYPGEILAIKGTSGVGKSTLAQVIAGLYEPDSGSIRLNEQILSSAARRQHFTFIEQEPWILEGTVKDNLLVAKPLAEPEELLNALMSVGLTSQEGERSFLNRLVSSSTLSTGQKQRIAIARGLLKKSMLFILDEPTASQDEINRRNILGILETLRKQDRIVIIVSHDEEALSLCDRIFPFPEPPATSHTLKVGLDLVTLH